MKLQTSGRGHEDIYFKKKKIEKDIQEERERKERERERVCYECM